MKGLLFFVALSYFIFSCNQNESPDFRNADWKPIDPSGYYEYIVTNQGIDPATENNRLILKIVGLLHPDDGSIDSSENKSNLFGSLAEMDITEAGFAKRLPSNTTGFVKMNYKKYIFGKYRETVHFTIFFNRNYDSANLVKDSAGLSAMKSFREIGITTPGEAIAKYEKMNAGDTSWRTFLGVNPLPATLELKLEDRFLQKDKFDSIENLLKNKFEPSEIHTGGIKEVIGKNIRTEIILIFKFHVF